MNWILLVVLCAVIIVLVISYARMKKREQELNQRLKISEQQYGDIQRQSSLLAEQQSLISSLKVEIAADEERLKAAKQLAEQAARLEQEKFIAEQQAIWAEDLNNLKRSHPIEKYQEQLAQLERSIEEKQKSLRIIQEQQREAKEQEEFNEQHSLHLENEDLSDIRLIYECSETLKRPSALRKAIWTEYYQKPLQELRKTLGADKVIGIYKITNKTNGRCYIGQSLDIGDRWQQHVKSGIGVGLISYITNKFYKTLHQEGAENFTFEILESCNKEDLDEREKYWIEFFGAKEYGYNSTGGNSKCRLNLSTSSQ